jgi:phosphoglycerate kinase
VQDVKLAKDVVGEDAQKLSSQLQDGGFMLLENVRFIRKRKQTTPRLQNSLCHPWRISM